MIPVQLFAQAVDVDVYRARPGIAVQAPDSLIQGLAVEQLPPGTDKGQQQIKLPGRQLYAGAVLGDDVVVRVDDGIESLQCVARRPVWRSRPSTRASSSGGAKGLTM